MIQNSGTSWEVKARAHVCSATGVPFEDGQTICSRLVRTVEGMERHDFAKDQWDGEKQRESLFHWKTVYHPPAPKKEQPFKEENAEEALRELMEQRDLENTNTLFILAAMLERKRLLIEKAVQRDDEGRKIRIYEHKDSGETYFIVDPEIGLEELAEVQDEVARKLGWIKEERVEEAPGEGDGEQESGDRGQESGEGEQETEDSKDSPEPEALEKES